MESTFSGLEIGKRSLIAHRKGLNVISHNLANSSQEGYSRQRVIFSTIDPLYKPDISRVNQAGQLGQGSEISSVRRERDIHLDTRIVTEKGELAFWKGEQKNLRDIESIHNALGETNFQNNLDAFWASWQELSLRPDEPAVREELLQSSLLLTQDIRSKFVRFNDLRSEFNEKVQLHTSLINALATNISKLNYRIEASKAAGDNPNDLLDTRDKFIEQLSEITSVKISFKDNDELMVFVKGNILVQGSKANFLETIDDGQNDGMYSIRWQQTGENFDSDKGSLLADLNMRDVHLPKAITQLDTIAVNLSYNVNEVHRLGFNFYGREAGNFFRSYYPGSDSLGRFDITRDGSPDSRLLFRLSGANKIEAEAIVGTEGVITLRRKTENGFSTQNVVYRADDKIKDILDRINLSEDSVNAYINVAGKLSIKSRTDTDSYSFALPYLEDSGEFLVGIAGILEAPNISYNSQDAATPLRLFPGAEFERSPQVHASAWIDVEKNIISDSNRIAAKGGTEYIPNADQTKLAFGQGDGQIAQEISALRYNRSFYDTKATLNEYSINTVASLAAAIESINLEVEKFEAGLNNLLAIRQSISGVNIDEEMSNMISYQQGYRAGAQIVKVMDELLDTLLRMVS